MSLPEKHLSIVYHSPYGHTAKVASAIASGAEVMGVKVHVMNIEHIGCLTGHYFWFPNLYGKRNCRF